MNCSEVVCRSRFMACCRLGVRAACPPEMLRDNRSVGLESTTVPSLHCDRLQRVRTALAYAVLVLAPGVAFAGGPKYVAGVSFFNPATLGQPVHWSAGQVNYYVDRGPLSASLSNEQATAMVDAAAALWSAVPTAAVVLTDMGPLNEDVHGANIAVTNGRIAAPADVTPAASTYPLGVIYDADGSVIDAIFGTGASKPTSCQNNGVWTWLDTSG